ncbi:hypothetical protein BD779DRAFT_1785085, partial [Infundibulicybe gibba]
MRENGFDLQGYSERGCIRIVPEDLARCKGVLRVIQDGWRALPAWFPQMKDDGKRPELGHLSKWLRKEMWNLSVSGGHSRQEVTDCWSLFDSLFVHPRANPRIIPAATTPSCCYTTAVLDGCQTYNNRYHPRLLRIAEARIPPVPVQTSDLRTSYPQIDWFNTRMGKPFQCRGPVTVGRNGHDGQTCRQDPRLELEGLRRHSVAFPRIRKRGARNLVKLIFHASRDCLVNRRLNLQLTH